MNSWLHLLHTDEHLDHLLVFRDTHDGQTFPVYVRDDEDLTTRIAQKTANGMFRLVGRYTALATGDND